MSGAAFGIDQAAHRGALANRGPTVAVLACGADRAYPAAHRNLIDYIADVGLVVSEAAPGCAPTRIRFLARNRVIAALARGAVVVEAAVRSGALNTASWAAGLGRAVMGVPGPVTSAPSAGVHQLIRARDALLVTSGEEVLEAVGPVGLVPLASRGSPERPATGSASASGRCSTRCRWCRRSTPAPSPAPRGSRTAAPRRRCSVLHRAGLVEHSLGRWRLAPGNEEPASTVASAPATGRGSRPRRRASGGPGLRLRTLAA